MKLSPSIERLIDSLRHLPGVGPKSAQRMTLHLLERDRDGAQQISDAIDQALERVQNCSRCRNFTELSVCEICADPKRDASTLCVVEAHANIMHFSFPRVLPVARAHRHRARCSLEGLAAQSGHETAGGQATRKRWDVCSHVFLPRAAGWAPPGILMISK